MTGILTPVKIKIITLLYLSLSIGIAEADELIKLDYKYWTINYSCEARAPLDFHFVTVPDTGNLKKYDWFHKEVRLPRRCQQFSGKKYVSDNKSTQYTRGAGVNQNLWDFNQYLMQAANLYSNITPIAENLRRGGVLEDIDNLMECYRDQGEVEVFGGNIFSDTSNDIFLESHGVKTPDKIWRVLQFPEGVVNAWLLPNDATTVGHHINDYLVAPALISQMTGIEFSFGEDEMLEKDSVSMSMPAKCSLQ